MAEKETKELKDVKEFIENVNKKDTKRNGKKITFGFSRRKRFNKR
jgi:hypothetical protein